MLPSPPSNTGRRYVHYRATRDAHPECVEIRWSVSASAGLWQRHGVQVQGNAEVVLCDRHPAALWRVGQTHPECVLWIVQRQTTAWILAPAPVQIAGRSTEDRKKWRIDYNHGQPHPQQSWPTNTSCVSAVGYIHRRPVLEVLWLTEVRSLDMMKMDT